MSNRISKIIIFFILAALVGGGFFSYGSYKSNRTNRTNNKSNTSNTSYKLPSEVPLKHPIPLLWTDDNKGENLIIQSDRRYYDGSTNSTVYFAITNQSGKDQKMKVSFEFKGKGKLSSIVPISSSHKKPLSRQGRMTRQSSILRSLESGFPRRLDGGLLQNKPLSRQGRTTNSYSFSDIILKNKTNFYQAKIKYPQGAKGEFIIIAKGDQGGYGKLDPYFSSGLVGYWSFNGQDINGTTAYDRSGQGNNGTIYGATPAIGKSGQALSFDGKDDYVNCGNDSSLNITDAITIEAWVKPNTLAGSHFIVDKYWDIYSINQSNNRFGIHYRDENNSLHNFSVSTNNFTFTKNWYHLVAVINSSDKVKTYVNGELKQEWDFVGTSINSNTRSLKIGVEENQGYFNGLIDEVRIYNRALSASEIAEHYRTESAKFKIKPN